MKRALKAVPATELSNSMGSPGRVVERETSSPLKSIMIGTALAVPVRVSATTAAERRFIPGKPMFLFSSG